MGTCDYWAGREIRIPTPGIKQIFFGIFAWRPKVLPEVFVKVKKRRFPPVFGAVR
jgi:hypothetical protein